nr:U3 small nucleolar RNA associated protein 15 [Hymenolepis microstoma]
MIRRVGVVTEYEAKKFDESIWDSFKKHGRLNLEKRINCVATNFKLPHKYAIPTGRSIIIYKAEMNKKHRRITGFQKPVTTCNYRADGKLIAGGTDNGFLHFCTTDKSSYHLKKFQAHNGEVLHVDFLPGGLKAMSLGKDGFAKQWDVALGQLITKYPVGLDNEPPSCMSVGRVNGNLFCAGDFTGAVSLFDLRQSSPAHKFTLRSSPSSLKFAYDDQIIVSAADQYVYTWDVTTRMPWLQTNLTPSDPLAHPGVYMHYKLITDMSIIHSPDVHQDPLLLSVGMDRLLRISSLKSLDVFHQERLPSPCTALAAFSDLRYVVVGMESGAVRTFSFVTPSNQMALKASSRVKEEEAFSVIDPEMRELAASFSNAGKKTQMSEKDLTADEWFKTPAPPSGRSRLAPKDWGFSGSRAPLIHEHTEISRNLFVAKSSKEPASIARLTGSLLRFQHTKALSEALRVVVAPEMAKAAVVAVVRELSRRATLGAAVAGQSEADMKRLLRFIRLNIWHPSLTPTCVHLLRTLTKVFGRPTIKKNKEYQRSCDILDRMSSNMNSMKCLAIRMRAILYPSEEVPAAQFLDAKVKQDAAEAIPLTGRKMGESKIPPKVKHARGGRKKKVESARAKYQDKNNVSEEETAFEKLPEREEASASVNTELKEVVNLPLPEKVVLKSSLTKENMASAAVELKKTEESVANFEVDEKQALSVNGTDGNSKKRIRKRRRPSRRSSEIEIDITEQSMKSSLIEESESDAVLTPSAKKRKH